MAKKTLRDIPDLRGKRVLLRVDFNVPLDENGVITNDRRIKAALPTIQYLLEGGASVIIMTHLGRPTGDPKKDAIFSTGRVASRLATSLMSKFSHDPRRARGVVGPEVESEAKSLLPGCTLMLENLRFDPGEQKGDVNFAAELAALGDVYVNDAFGTCHRSDASMVAVPKAMAGKPRVVGFLVAKELEILEQLLSKPPRPLLGVMGGAKVSDKIGFIRSMLSRVDKLLVGGAMTYTFMKAMGQNIGRSRVEADKLEVARELLELGKGKIVLPSDHVIADKPEATAQTKIVTCEIPDNWFGMDIGPATTEVYAKEIGAAGITVWNGPMGKFEDEPFANGTRGIAEAMAKSKGITIVGGGETAEAVEEFGLADKMTHVSTGGGAFLEYVEGTPFAALAEIDDR